jgi:hypothetical protein
MNPTTPNTTDSHIAYPKTLLTMLEQAQATNARLTAELEAMTTDRDKYLKAAESWYQNSREWLNRWRHEREKNDWQQRKIDKIMGWNLTGDETNEEGTPTLADGEDEL